MKIARVDCWPILLPLVGVFRSGHGAKNAQPGLALRITTASGETGEATVDPSPGYSRYDAPQSARIIRNTLAPALIGRDAQSIRALVAVMDTAAPDAFEAKAAIEIALFDLNARQLGVPVHRLLGGAIRREVSFNGWVGMLPPAEAAAIAHDFAERGFPSVKVKAGEDIASDSARIAAVREANPGLAIRIDANESFDADAAIAFGRAVARYDISLLEQPVPHHDIAGMARVRRSIDIPVMADESVYQLDSIIEIIKREAADIIKVKVMKQGGLLRTLQGIEICEAAGIPCVLGHGFGSGLHTLAEIHLAAVASNVLEGCEAVGPTKLADDVTMHRLEMPRGVLPVPTGSGLGARLDETRLDRYRTAPAATAADER